MDGIVETDSEDELPAEWEERVMLDGRVYYASHTNKTTQWDHPVTGKKKMVKGDLPYGWERKVADDGRVSYVDHINNKTTFTDPRLAFAEELKSSPMDIRQKFDSSSTALSILHGRDLSKQYVIVTGCNCGIGYETARSLALHGAHVTMACRNVTAAEEARDTILAEHQQARVVVMQIDLASLRSVKQFADHYRLKQWPLHLLILNAAAFNTPFTLTEDGLECQFQVNHLAHFYLTQQLKEILIKSAPARIVVVSSESHRFSGLKGESLTLDQLSPSSPSNYNGMRSYNISKLCNIMFAIELNSQLSQYGITANSLHPGNMMSTSLARHGWFMSLLFTIVRPFTKSMQQGAATTVYVSVAPELEGVGGLYFNSCCQCQYSKNAGKAKKREQVWKLSEDILKEKMGPYENKKASG